MKVQIYPLFIVISLFYFDLSASSFLPYNEGDQCDKYSQGTCQNVKKCPLEAEKVKKGIAPDICGLKQNDLVCCNKILKHSLYTKQDESLKEETVEKQRKVVKREAPGEKSRRMCKKYAESVYSYEDSPVLIEDAPKIKRDNCGILEAPLVVGGELAKPKEFPHMVLVGHSQNGSDDIYWQCGGSLISDRWVLSAAHCTYTKKGIANWATVGDLKVLSNEDADDSKPVTLKIIDRKNHPDYDTTKGYNDIALYKLEKKVEFNAYVRPICLRTQDGPHNGKVIATGWGDTRWRGFASNDLLKVVLNLYDMNQCNSLFKNSRKPYLQAKIPEGVTAHNLVCAWEKGKDTCQGDSGGPLQVRTEDPYCMYSIIGITSFGDECAKELPGIYTRVSFFIPWIESLVWP